MKITKDNFVWKLVTDKAKEVFKTGLFELYALHNDESESLIENYSDINEALESGLEIGISVGRIETKEGDFEKENKLLIQYFRKLRSQLLDGRFKEDSVLIKAIDYALDGKKELRVYLVDGYFWRNRVNDCDDEEFMSMAEAEGKIYSLQGFVKAFNEEEINTFVDFIRII